MKYSRGTILSLTLLIRFSALYNTFFILNANKQTSKKKNVKVSKFIKTYSFM